MFWKTTKGNSDNLIITGTYNYFLDVSIKGLQSFQNCSIAINAFQKEDKKIVIPIKCTWSRVKVQRNYPLIGINSNTYQCSSQDYLTIIKAEIIPQDDEFQGTAIVQFGPIKLDPQLKLTLEGILGQGGSKFPINFYDQNSDIPEKESSSIFITSDYIRFERFDNKSVKFQYTLDFPILEMNYLDVYKMALVAKQSSGDFQKLKQFMNDDSQDQIRIHFKAQSRSQRDLILLTIKCFATKNYLVNSKIINNIDVCLIDTKLFSDDATKQRFTGDLLLEIESIKKELKIYIDFTKELTLLKDQQTDEIKKLEEEVKSTIETYQRVIEDIKNQKKSNNDNLLNFSSAKIQDDFDNIKQRQNLQIINKKYEEQIKQLTAEVQAYKNLKGNNNGGYFEESRYDFKSNDQSEVQHSMILQKVTRDQNVIQYNNDNIIKQLRIENEKYKNKIADLEKEIRETRIQSNFQQTSSLKQSQTNIIQQSLPLNIKNSGIQQPSIDFSLDTSQLKIKNLEKLLADSQRQNEIMLNELNQLRQDSQQKYIRYNSPPSNSQKFSSSQKQVEQLENELKKVKQELQIYQKDRLQTKQSPLIQSNNSNDSNSENIKDEINKQNNKIQLLQKQIEALQLQNQALQNQSFCKESFIEKGDDQLKFLEERILEQKKINQRLTEDLKVSKKKIENMEKEIQRNKLYKPETDSAFMGQSSTFNQTKDLQYENDLLIQQRNQLSKKVESLQKELESQNKKQSTPTKNNSQLENLIKTNQRLMEENNSLVFKLKQLQEELDSLKNVSKSRLDQSMYNSHIYNRDDIDMLEKKLNDANNMNELLMIQVNEYKRQIEELKDKLSSNKQGSSHKIELELANYKEKCAKLEKDLLIIKNEIKNDSGDQDSKKQRDKYKLEVKTLKEENIILQSQIKKLSEQNTNLLNENSQLNQKIFKLEQSIEDIRNKSVNQSYLSNHEELEEAKRLQQIYKLDAEKNKYKVQELEQQIHKLKSDTPEKNKFSQSMFSEQVSSLQEQLSMKQRVIEQLQNQNSKLLKENIEVADQLRTVQEELDVYKSVNNSKFEEHQFENELDLSRISQAGKEQHFEFDSQRFKKELIESKIKKSYF